MTEFLCEQLLKIKQYNKKRKEKMNVWCSFMICSWFCKSLPRIMISHDNTTVKGFTGQSVSTCMTTDPNLTNKDKIIFTVHSSINVTMQKVNMHFVVY